MVNPNQTGRDLSSFSIDGGAADMDFWSSGYEAQAGALDHQTVSEDGAGNVVGSEYLYTGGVFELFFALEKDGVHTIGSFIAPITALTITAGEGDGTYANASFVLGPGLFDQAIADLLGIGRHTKGDITLEAPEPATFLLAAGSGALWVRRRSRR